MPDPFAKEVFSTPDSAHFRRPAELSGRTVVGEQRGFEYRIERWLGEGGQGSAWLAARLGATPGPLVVKVLHPAFVRQDRERASLVFRKEVVALSRLAERVPPTPFVVGLEDHGELDWDGVRVPWLGLEYVPGGALGGDLGARVAEAVQSTGWAFSPERARRILGCLVAGLAALHELDVIHRDLKPSNVLVCGVGDDELAKVADLGAARPLGMVSTFGADAQVGEPGYAAPEQQKDNRVGTWSDVFSLAALSYLVLTGEAMFAGTPPVALARTFRGQFEPLSTRPRLHSAWRSAEVLDGIEAVLRRATRLDPSERFATVRDFWAELTPWFARAVAVSPARSSHVVCKATLESAKREPWTFQCSAPAAPGFALRSCAFDPDGHGLAITEQGLAYWQGTRWIPMAAPAGVRPEVLRHVVRVGPCLWLAVGDEGEVVRFEPTKCQASERLGRQGPRFCRVHCVGEDGAFVAIGSRNDGSWLYVFDGQRWHSPLALPGAHAQAVCKLDTPMLLIGASDARAKGPLWLYRGAGRLWMAEQTSTAVSCLAATRAGAVALSISGMATFLDGEGKIVGSERAWEGGPVTAVVEDSAGVLWACARGALLRRERPGNLWSKVFDFGHCQAPIAELYVGAGLLQAAATDGTIITGHQMP